MRRVDDEVVRQALIVPWEAADRICGNRLKVLLPSLVKSREQHGHLSLEDHVRTGVLTMSAATIDRKLAPTRRVAGGKKRCRPEGRIALGPNAGAYVPRLGRGSLNGGGEVKRGKLCADGKKVLYKLKQRWKDGRRMWSSPPSP